MRLVELDQIVASEEFLLEHLDVSLELLNFFILVFQLTHQGFFLSSSSHFKFWDSIIEILCRAVSSSELRLRILSSASENYFSKFSLSVEISFCSKIISGAFN